MDKRRTGLVIAAGALLILAAHPPSANLRIEMHNPADTAPHRMVAAIDIGVMAASVLVTWSAKAIAR